MTTEIERISTTEGSMRSEGGFLSRGDGPAQAVLHANAQAMSLRKAAETQEELGKINNRVEMVSILRTFLYIYMFFICLRTFLCFNFHLH